MSSTIPTTYHQGNGSQQHPCLAAALAYLAHGWSPIPLCPPDHSGWLPARHAEHCKCHGKRPVVQWREYQHARMTAKQLAYQWRKNPAYNVGLVLGAISDLVAFDVDGPAGEDELLRICEGRIPPTWEFSTGGAGRRLLLGLGGRPAPQTRYRLNGAPLDFLGAKSQTVMPPSLHRSGLPYQWAPGHGPEDVPLAELTEGLRQAVTRATGQQTTTRPPVGPAGTIEGLARRVIRARGDVATWEPCVSGAGGHGRIFKLACRLVHGYGLDVDTAFLLMAERWNDTCEPPWTEEELRAELVGAQLRGSCPPIPERPMPAKSSTRMPDPPGGSPARANGQTASATSEAAGGGPEASARSSGSSTSSGSSVPPPDGPPSPRIGRRLGDRPAPKTEWFWPPYIPRAKLSLLVGREGTGKSTFGGFLMAKASRSLLLAGGEEDPEEMMLPRVDAHGGNHSNVYYIYPSEWKPPKGHDILIDLIRWWKAELVVIDPLDSFFPDGQSQNDELVVRAFQESLVAVAKETGAAFVGIRHPGKGDNLMVNSRAWREVVRSIIELVVDPGPPVQRIIRPFKDNLGQNWPPRKYDLVGAGPHKPPLFTLGKLVNPIDAAELAEPARPGERSKKERALEMIPWLLRDGPMASKDVYAAGARDGLSVDVMDKAARQLGVIRPRSGTGHAHVVSWELPPAEGSAE